MAGPSGTDPRKKSGDSVKRVLPYLITAAVALVCGAAILFFGLKLAGRDGAERFLFGRAEPDSAAEQERSLAVDLALEAAADLKDGDFAALSELVHPSRGLLFTPYSTVNLSSDRWFTASEVAALDEDAQRYTWGMSPVTGEVMEMTARDFVSGVIYDYDYVSAPVISLNYIAARGNALENVSEAFPDAVFVDLHNPGTDGRWTTLRLVFENQDGNLWLVAVVHCQYTV